MKFISTASIEINASDIQLLECLSGGSTETFEKKCELLNLNPRLDFRYADLGDVDVSGSDLSGFDFRYSNLRNVTGVNVRWDSSTCFEGADLSGSCFNSKVKLDKAFSENPELEKQYQKIRNSDWSERSIWVLDRSRNAAGSRFIAARLFLEDISLTDRTNLILALGERFEKEDDFLEFLLHVISARQQSDGLVIASLQMLQQRFSARESTHKVMRHFLNSPETKLRAVSMSSLFKLADWRSFYPEILRNILIESDSGVRRDFLANLASKLGGEFSVALHDPAFSGSAMLDFRATLDLAKMREMIHEFLKSRRFVRPPPVELLDYDNKIMNFFDPWVQRNRLTHREVELAINFILHHVFELRKYGIEIRVHLKAPEKKAAL